MIVIASGTHTTGGGTEETVHTLVAPGHHAVAVDVNAVASGDQYELRIKGPVLSGGTAREIAPPGILVFTGLQLVDKISMAQFLATQAGYLFTLKRTAGSDRAIPWAILREFAVGQVVADASNTASTFFTNLPGGNDTHIGKFLRFLTGANAGQVKKITDFTDTNGVVDVSPAAFTDIPANDDVFDLINR